MTEVIYIPYTISPGEEWKMNPNYPSNNEWSEQGVELYNKFVREGWIPSGYLVINEPPDVLIHLQILIKK